MELRRRELILKYTVELFIKTAIPVGSQTLIENYKLSFSSATIRAEMNALEHAGYLEKTHISSGRVPSSKGYKYYVDHLRDVKVDQNIKNQIAKLIDAKSRTIEELVKSSVEILSSLTNMTSVVLGPNAHQDRLASIQLIPLGHNSATAIFVTDRGYVESKTFLIPPKTTAVEMSKVVAIFNERLAGTLICEVVGKMDALQPMLKEYVIEQQVIYEAFTEAFVRYAKDRLSLYGKESLLEQPEFVNNPEKLRKLITILDDPEKLKELISEGEEFSVVIGKDDSDLSVISSTLRVPGREQGKIVLVGPKRMDYDAVVSALEYVTDALEQYFDKESRLNDE
ncbi:MAG TPA: heat-inducible transcriptional repressor HrcA [Bacilli bacterium]|nr:heat-inducible transcriptional repressor HrcA [Bacilli bacterium]